MIFLNEITSWGDPTPFLLEDGMGELVMGANGKWQQIEMYLVDNAGATPSCYLKLWLPLNEFNITSVDSELLELRISWGIMYETYTLQLCICFFLHFYLRIPIYVLGCAFAGDGTMYSWGFNACIQFIDFLIEMYFNNCNEEHCYTHKVIILNISNVTCLWSIWVLYNKKFLKVC